MTTPLAAALFSPRGIALIGASADPARVPARAQRYLRRHGFPGALFPINPRTETVQGEPAYPSLAAVPGPIDLAYILLGTGHVEAAIADCAAHAVPLAMVLADGFAESGADGAARQARLLAVAREAGVRLLGPNSMGMINVPASIACSVNAALEAERLPAGRWSLVSQSGSVMGTLMSRAAARGQGFAKLVGMGNEADLTAGEVVRLLVDDPDTDAILLFLETIRRPDLFADAARAAHAAGKPLIAYKLGRSEAGAKLAATHTGAMAGSDAAAEAFFRAHGIVRVDMIETLLDLPPLLLGRRPPRDGEAAPRRAVRVVTTTGGGGAMVVDRLGLAGVATAHMLDTTLAGMGRDSIATALAEARAAEDAGLAIAVIGSSAQFRPEDAVAGVVAAHRAPLGASPGASSGAPLGALEHSHPICAFLVPHAETSLRLLTAAGIAAFRNPEPCADGVRAYLDWRAPRVAPPAGDVSAAAALVAAADDEPGARAVFAALGVPDTARRIDPAAPPADLRYPVALKAVSGALAHKTEAGAVALGVADAAALAARAREMAARVGDVITGFLAQPMAHGVGEAILGYRRDPMVGPVVVLGAGGVLAEVYRDVVLRLAPVSFAEAMEMIEAVNGLAPARGYRGLPKGDLAALARAVAAFSRLAALDNVTEAEINPVIVLAEGDGVVMADALLRRGAP
ncbi:MAG: acetate--CoA ligase family protein [Acetobacteraceae bacterium]